MSTSLGRFTLLIKVGEKCAEVREEPGNDASSSAHSRVWLVASTYIHNSELIRFQGYSCSNFSNSSKLHWH